jgi:large subunit ribosomal protein L31
MEHPMKDGIHPNYREVCFLDLSNNFKFVTRSCVNAKEMIKMEDGRELPLYKLDTSSESHPFYTGTQKPQRNKLPRALAWTANIQAARFSVLPFLRPTPGAPSR